MAQTIEGASECVEAVRFSFMTQEEVRRHSVMKITNPNLLDSMQSPVSGGLYDPALGPLDDKTPCKSCGQRSFHCPGHCGHIDLVLTVYNPLLFDTLYSLLQRTCFFCFHFRASGAEVEKCAAQLELIAKGDIVGAKRLDSSSPSESVDSEDSDGSHVSCSTSHLGAQNYSSEAQRQQEWTSLQFTEAMSALQKFFKLKYTKCMNCKAKNPKISKPTFGWFHMNVSIDEMADILDLTGMSGSHTRANVIRGCKLEGPFNGGTEERPSSEVLNADEHPREIGLDTAETNSFSDVIEEASTKSHASEKARAPVEFLKQNKFFSGPILPSEPSRPHNLYELGVELCICLLSQVINIVKRLWENEAYLCSFICDIQQGRLNTSGKKTGHSMFFLEAILIPPIKFRPATKGGDAVMEHPHTVLLGKVLQSNIALGNARVNNSEPSKIVSRWMDLQQSVNVLFDSKTAAGQGQRDVSTGISQLLEKKEGIFRQKMMGKRVNYACRSVISPDPYLAVNEIGIPPYFALRLTYPEVSITVEFGGWSLSSIIVDVVAVIYCQHYKMSLNSNGCSHGNPVSITVEFGGWSLSSIIVDVVAVIYCQHYKMSLNSNGCSHGNPVQLGFGGIPRNCEICLLDCWISVFDGFQDPMLARPHRCLSLGTQRQPFFGYERESNVSSLLENAVLLLNCCGEGAGRFHIMNLMPFKSWRDASALSLDGNVGSLRVTHWNVVKLRDAIVNGSEFHPGATHYADKVSTVRLPPSKKMRIAISRKLPSSRGVVTQSAKICDYEFEGKTVYRHLQDGDIVLVNRQPTLHKPSIMAHVVRVLKGEKTLRMHYANCSTYNADFDGDEMNVHLPQDEVSRAEAYNIVNANNQYIVPTRGDPVRGLIQDHIVSAVLLTMKNTFLTRDEYNQLLYGSGVFSVPGSLSANPSRKISVVDSEGSMLHVLPAVWKPKPLWTGKQVITAVLNHITQGYPPCTVENEGKIPNIYFTSKNGKNLSSKVEEDNAENKLLIWRNELVHGVIDKAQFGKYGLVHTVQELYGSNSAGILLSVLSRLFTIFLQIHGFTCGVDDLMILPHSDIQRQERLEHEDVGEEVHCEFVNFKYGEIGQTELQLETEKAIRSNGQSAIAYLDMKMKNKLNEKTSQINKELLLKGLSKPFPKNCISLMTISGAKGSTVNFQQISSSLGQQELEGKRVPRMVSGKTLPCFPPWDFASRAGGFITDRFLTGLRPQEYYFHCMAGREG
ncbi:unnamed protein product [Ilex paraguariensis]|uniref:DNA-directed RNA polymerase subunit n=1 Tax=Ilex paraguariensis TaxID=185542 RepID=A0ABC8SJ20_9AQUA